MRVIEYQVTGLMIVYSNVYSGANQRKHPSFASLVFVRGIHLGAVNSPHKGPVARKRFPFDDVIMYPLVNEVIIGSHNVLSPVWRQVITGTNT